MITGIKTRTFKEHNYHAIWFNGKTLRVAIDPTKPITELRYPEFYDVKITNTCNGLCPYCYQDSKPNMGMPLILGNFYSYFKSMNPNERPFQIAIGGGEPTMHPDFVELLMLSDSLGIVPNYTTNGMWSDGNKFDIHDILYATKTYCGGVAVSTHAHLKSQWKYATKLYIDNGIKVNLHIIISDEKSIDDFVDIYKTFPDVEYFVLLPLTNSGRCDNIGNVDWEYLMKRLPDTYKIAFGANFYPYLMQEHNKNLGVSLYEPEILSGYLDMTNMKLYKSSFNLTEKFA